MKPVTIVRFFAIIAKLLLIQIEQGYLSHGQHKQIADIRQQIDQLLQEVEE